MKTKYANVAEAKIQPQTETEKALCWVVVRTSVIISQYENRTIEVIAAAIRKAADHFLVNNGISARINETTNIKINMLLTATRLSASLKPGIPPPNISIETG